MTLVPDIVTSANEIVQESENINIESENLEEIVKSFDPDKINSLYDSMIKLITYLLLSLLILYPILNSFSWYVTFKIFKRKTKGFFQKYFLSFFVHGLILFAFTLFLFNSEYDKNSLIILSFLSIIILFFMYLSQSSLTSFYPKFKHKLTVLFFVWLITTFVIVWQMYYVLNYFPSLAFISVIIIILVQTWLRGLFVEYN